MPFPYPLNPLLFLVNSPGAGERQKAHLAARLILRGPSRPDFEQTLRGCRASAGPLPVRLPGRVATLATPQAIRVRAFRPTGKFEARFQCLKWRTPVKTMAMPRSLAAAMTSASRMEPPGWITQASDETAPNRCKTVLNNYAMQATVHWQSDCLSLFSK